MIEARLCEAVHCCKGIARPLPTDENKNADESKYVLTWRATDNYIWSAGDIVRIPPPAGFVFVVVITENIKHKTLCPEISGWIEHWSWIKKTDGPLIGAPINRVDRYYERIGSATASPIIRAVSEIGVK